MAKETKMQILTANDGKVFKFEEAIARQSETLKAIIDEDNFEGSTSRLPNVNGLTPEKIIEFCRRHDEFRKTSDKDPGANQSDDAKAFNRSFVDGLKEGQEMVEIFKGAHYLGVKELLDVISLGIADRIKNMTLENVWKFFGLQSDYTEEEENAFREDFLWAFDDLDQDYAINSGIGFLILAV